MAVISRLPMGGFIKYGSMGVSADNSLSDISNIYNSSTGLYYNNMKDSGALVTIPCKNGFMYYSQEDYSGESRRPAPSQMMTRKGGITFVGQSAGGGSQSIQISDFMGYATEQSFIIRAISLVGTVLTVCTANRTYRTTVPATFARNGITIKNMVGFCYADSSTTFYATTKLSGSVVYF